MYVNYSYYIDTYGGSVPRESFAALEQKAEAYIRYFTYVNGDIFATIDTAVQNAVCAAIDCISQRAEVVDGTVKIGGRAYKSESNDGYSVTYTDGETSGSAEDILRSAVLSAVRVYLLPTGWLTRRVRCCHVHDHACDGI